MHYMFPQKISIERLAGRRPARSMAFPRRQFETTNVKYPKQNPQHITSNKIRKFLFSIARVFFLSFGSALCGPSSMPVTLARHHSWCHPMTPTTRTCCLFFCPPTLNVLKSHSAFSTNPMHILLFCRIPKSGEWPKKHTTATKYAPQSCV